MDTSRAPVSWQIAREWGELRSEAQPGWAGVATIFGTPLVRGADPEADRGSTVAIAGVPVDSTASSRPGALEGPRAIRQASLIYSSYLSSLGETEMLDMRTGRRFAYRAPSLVDVGDFHVYPTDPIRNLRRVAAEARRLSLAYPSVVFLGGDHSVTFPLFAGFGAAQLEAREGATIGFVNIDHHFDFGDSSSVHGRFYHGSNSRRISELPGMRPQNIAFLGVGDATRASQYDQLQRDGYHIIPAALLRSRGPDAARAVIEDLGSRCDTVYVSIDIDVLDCAYAPGTGNVTIGGLEPGLLLDTFLALSQLPTHAFDIVEVAPRYDPTGRTAQIAARILFERLFRSRPDVDVDSRDSRQA